MRRSLCIRPALCLMLVCLLLLPCAGCGEKTDPFQSYFSEKPFVEFLTEEDTATLRAQFPEEFQWLDVMLGPVTLFREEALELVTEQAIEDSGSGFAQIPGAAYALAFERAAQDFNAAQEANVGHGQLGLLRGNQDQVEVRNRKTKTLVPSQALKAVEGNHVGQGGHLSETISVGYSTNDTILGYAIGSASVSYDVTYTLDGPTGAERVGDHRATHRWGFAVLYGSIVEVSYDLYDVRTDKLISHYSMNSIVAPRGVDQNFLFSITGKDGVYVLQAEGNAVFHFTSIDKAVNAICKYPASYI